MPEADRPQTNDTPLSLTFELDRLTIPIGALRSLSPGYVFELMSTVDRPVTVRVNDCSVAHAELHESEGSLVVLVKETL